MEEPPMRLCPCCGGEAMLMEAKATSSTRRIKQYLIRCRDCPLETMKRSTVSAVVLAWNQRVGPEGLMQDVLREIRALREVCEQMGDHQ